MRVKAFGVALSRSNMARPGRAGPRAVPRSFYQHGSDPASGARGAGGGAAGWPKVSYKGAVAVCVVHSVRPACPATGPFPTTVTRGGMARVLTALTACRWVVVSWELAGAPAGTGAARGRASDQNPHPPNLHARAAVSRQARTHHTSALRCCNLLEHTCERD